MRIDHTSGGEGADHARGSNLTEIRIDGYDNPVAGFVNSLPWKRSVTNFNFVNNMAFKTPSVRTATLVETAVAVEPAANAIVALTVNIRNAGGTCADAAL